MLWFLIGFLWGVFAAQETPHLPNVRDGTIKMYEFLCDIFSEQNLKREPATRSKSE